MPKKPPAALSPSPKTTAGASTPARRSSVSPAKRAPKKTSSRMAQKMPTIPADLVVTYSELDSFRQCPLKHHWSYRDRWVEEAKPGSALSRGSLWHLVMECHYTWVQRYHGKGLTVEFLRQWMAQHLLFDQAGGQNDDQVLVEWMYDGYLECYGLDDRWRVDLIEYDNQVPLPAPDGGPPIDLRFKIDLLVRDSANDQLWLVDHKSARDFSRQTEIDLDDQFGLYSWALRKLGYPVVGTVRSDARTQRNKGPMRPDQRFRRVYTYRTDHELDNIARDAYAVARAAWFGGQDRTLYSSPLTFTCSWRCSFVQPHIELRKGTADEQTLMQDFGFSRSDKKHREYDQDPVVATIPDGSSPPRWDTAD